MRAINSVEGYDIRIGVYSDAAGTSAGDIYIGSVEVRKVFPREPVRVNVTSPYYGNIFGGAEEKKFDVSFENLVDDNLDTTVTYNIVDEAGTNNKGRWLLTGHRIWWPKQFSLTSAILQNTVYMNLILLLLWILN